MVWVLYSKEWGENETVLLTTKNMIKLMGKKKNNISLKFYWLNWNIGVNDIWNSWADKNI